MRYDTTGAYRSINAAGRVTINRNPGDPGVVLSLAELDKRIKTGEFRIQQFKDAVANLKQLRRAAPVPQYVERVVREYVTSDTVRLYGTSQCPRCLILI